MKTGGAVMGVEAAAAGAPRRLRRSVAEKRRIVAATLEPGASVARVARANGVNANQLHYWRRQFQAGRLGAAAEQALVPVRIAEEPRAKRERRREGPAPGAIEIELAQGRLRIEAGADAALLRMLLGLLLA
jgi:transposase